jgi:outer membrane protein assembly factor BamA
VTGLGPDPEFWRVEGNWRLAVPLGEDTTLQSDGWAGFSGEDLPVYERFRLGGPVLLPGYHIDEQWGAQVLASSVTVRHQILRSVHLVVRAGAGNVWERREDIAWKGLRYGASVGLYRPSPIGPIAFDFGVSRGGGTLATLSLGFP